MDALDSIISPLKPILSPITNNLPGPLNNFAVSLIGQQCNSALIQKLDFSAANEACVKLAISKALGVAIISAASIVKIPQLIKLVNSQSAIGLSFLSYVLETASYTVTLAYSVRNGFPFSTFGETAFIAIQDVAIAALILVYSGRSTGAAAFIAVFAGVLYALFGPGDLVDMKTLSLLQACAGVLGLAAKVPQIWTIWSEGATGQLSAFAVFNYLFGSLSRIFTTIQEVDDKLILFSYIAGFALNAVLAGQMIYYWNASPTGSPGVASAEKARGDALKHIQMNSQGRDTASQGQDSLLSGTAKSTSLGSGDSSASVQQRKGPSTRRRG